MVEAGLLERLPEGAQVFYRISDGSAASGFAQALAALIPEDDAGLARDFSRLQQVRDARSKKAQDYFRTVAESWDTIRALYVPGPEVETQLLTIVGKKPVNDLLDIGTGTGRILKILAPRANRAVGIDLSSEMLTVARSHIEQTGLTNIHFRKGDMYQLPFDNQCIDLAVIHMVLHYSD